MLFAGQCVLSDGYENVEFHGFRHRAQRAHFYRFAFGLLRGARYDDDIYVVSLGAHLLDYGKSVHLKHVEVGHDKLCGVFFVQVKSLSGV